MRRAILTFTAAALLPACETGAGLADETADIADIAITSDDIEAGIAAIEARNDATQIGDEGIEDSLAILRAQPDETLQSWRRLYDEQDPTQDVGHQTSLAFLLGELCLPGSADVLSELAAHPLPAEHGDGDCSGSSTLERAETVQTQLFRSLGKVSAKACEMGVERELEARRLLADWVIDTSRSPRTRQLAGEALLEHHPTFAATLRPELSDDEDWMLAPFEERRVEMFVEDTPPDSPEALASGEPVAASVGGDTFSAGAPEPLAAVSAACASRLSAGWPTSSTSDSYIDSLIYWNSWLGVESCGQLHSRYDSEVIFQNNTWDEGFGWNDPCNATKPMKRAINSFWVIEHASDTMNAPGDYSGGVIHWAWDYIKAKTPEFEGSCSSSAIAATNTNGFCFWPFCGDERIRLMLPFWDQNVATRAGTLIHEARHAGGYDHNASDSSCPREGSCDTSYSYRGANTLQVQWLAQYYRSGNASNYAARSAALGRANHILRRGYATCPNVQLNSAGYFYTVPGCS